LHDTLLQSFHGLMLRFQAVQNMLAEQPGKARDSLEKAITRAAEANAKGRDAVQELRGSKVSNNDLVESLTSLGQELRANHGNAEDRALPTFGVVVEGTPRPMHPILRDDI
jgi:signal transduction histidine kinase